MFSQSTSQHTAISLRDYTSRIGTLIRQSATLRNQWIIAELSDVGTRGGHCYMELIEKDERGNTIARMRATIWANIFLHLKAKFEYATNQTFMSGLKVMILGSANFHEQYGFSFNITDIDPTFTLGDMARIRQEIINRLTTEGIINRNQQIEMPIVPQRIAIISAAGAAGYGDFMNQLKNNRNRFVFYTHLFNATMQGEQTSKSVRNALEQIEMTVDLWDCIVIIRGGGATSDLNGFDELELARAVALSPLPVIVGIGHERDRTVLDDIAHTRVKTPTAAAEFLINKAQAALDLATQLADFALRYATDRIAGEKLQLSNIESLIPSLTKQKITEKNLLLNKITTAIPIIVQKNINRHRQLLDSKTRELVFAGNRLKLKSEAKANLLTESIRQVSTSCISREKQRLTGLYGIIEALSPQNTLRRGYSITRQNGIAVKNANQLTDGEVIITTFADGSITSLVNKKQ